LLTVEEVTFPVSVIANKLFIEVSKSGVALKLTLLYPKLRDEISALAKVKLPKGLIPGVWSVIT
jgi:hypothetical protein